VINPVRRIYHPELYQGSLRRPGRFEGWYFKTVSADGSESIALIPGVARPEDGPGHAFVQVIRSNGATSYFEYPLSEFWTSPRSFELEVGGSRFSETGISLDLAGEGGHFVGELALGEWSRWPVGMFAPGAMGPYRFAPFMECYHGVLSMAHSVDGIVESSSGQMVFRNARGYAEKDWGRSFPSAWVWAQCNSFADPGVSVMVSVARVPWLRSAFTGLIAGVLVEGRLFRFATYTGTRLQYVSIAGGRVELVMADETHRLTLKLAGARPGQLRSPVAGLMDGQVFEALEGSMHVRLEASSGSSWVSLLEEESDRAAVEIMDPNGTLNADER